MSHSAGHKEVALARPAYPQVVVDVRRLKVRFVDDGRRGPVARSNRIFTMSAPLFARQHPPRAVRVFPRPFVGFPDVTVGLLLFLRQLPRLFLGILDPRLALGQELLKLVAGGEVDAQGGEVQLSAEDRVRLKKKKSGTSKVRPRHRYIDLDDKRLTALASI